MEHRFHLIDLGTGDLQLSLGDYGCSTSRIIDELGDCAALPELCLSRICKIGIGSGCLLHDFCCAGLGEIGLGSIAPEPDLIGVQPGKNLACSHPVIVAREDLDDLTGKPHAAAQYSPVPTQNSECRRNSRISLAFGVHSRCPLNGIVPVSYTHLRAHE